LNFCLIKKSQVFLFTFFAQQKMIFFALKVFYKNKCRHHHHQERDKNERWRINGKKMVF